MTRRTVFVTIMLLVVLVFAAAIQGVPSARAAGPWYVSPTGNDSNNCLTPATACASINAALAKPGFIAGDTALVAAGTYYGTGQQVVMLNVNVTLSGGWDGAFTQLVGVSTIDGDGVRRGISVGSGVLATVDYFVIQNGNAYNGGGIANGGAALTLNHSLVTHNHASNAGGIDNGAGSLTLNDSIVSHNHGDSHGGGIMAGGMIILNRSSVVENEAGGGGGGIFVGTGLVSNNSSVSGNTSTVGGGIYAYGNLELNSSTIADNRDPNNAGGIYSIGTYGGVATLRNTIVANNVGPDCGGSGFVSEGYNLIGSMTGCPFTPTLGDLTDINPAMGSLVGWPPYHPLFVGSPAIDAGNPGGCIGSTGVLTTDQRGVPRVGVCDMGAYEYTTPGAPASISTQTGTPQHAVPLQPFVTPLRAYVLDALGSPVTGTSVLFNAPADGASGSFTGSGTFTATVLTDPGGVATAPDYTANGSLGLYTVTARVGGVVTPANFLLGNIAWLVSYGSDSNDCLSPDTACASINGALHKADFFPGDTVRVAAARYYGTLTDVVTIDRPVIVSGGWDYGFESQTGYSVIDGNGQRRGILNTSTALFDRFIIENGLTPTNDPYALWGPNGGGIKNLGALTLIHTIVRNNATTNYYQTHGGGGIYNTGSLTLTESSVTDNSAPFAGGGGLLVEYGTAVINNSTIARNHARGGGGIAGGTVTLNSSTVVSNTTDWANNGGGLNSSGGVTLRNTIIAYNISGSSASDCIGSVASAGYNLIGSGAGCTFSRTEGDLVGQDARLASPAGSPLYYPLLNNSPAVNAGDPAGCSDGRGRVLATDERGALRFGRCDIGAYELQPLGFSHKIVEPASILPNNLVTFTLIVTNGGLADLPHVILTDTIPPELSYVPDSLTGTIGGTSMTNSVISWTGVLSAMHEARLTYQAVLTTGVMLTPAVPSAAAISGDGETYDREVVLAVTAGSVCAVAKHPAAVLEPGPAGTWDSAGVFEPVVVRDGSVLRMWYSGTDATGAQRIGYATSVNGTTWTKYAGNPVLVAGNTWEGTRVFAPHVILDGGTYEMWYTGRDSLGTARIGHASSSDGISWVKDAMATIDVGAAGSYDDAGVSAPTVLKTNAGCYPTGPEQCVPIYRYDLWYTAYDGATYRIAHAYKSPLSWWSKDGVALDVGASGAWDWLNSYGPSILSYGGRNYMFYSGETLPLSRGSGLATSTGAGPFIRQGLLLASGMVGAYDAGGIESPTAVAAAHGWDVWFSARDSLGVYRIGYAAVNICDARKIYLPVVMKGYAPGTCTAYYTDNFSNPTSGWPLRNDITATFAYTGGEYQLNVKKKSYEFLVTPGAKAVDFTAAVTARRVGGTSGVYGIAFGINDDWSQFYEFDIEGSQYSVWKWSGYWSNPVPNTASPYINAGTTPNRIKVIRNGASIDMYANDHFLATLTDGSFAGLRRVGLMTQSSSGGPIDARFDDFQMYPATCGGSAYASSVSSLALGEPGSHKAQPKPGAAPCPDGMCEGDTNESRQLYLPFISR